MCMKLWGSSTLSGSPLRGRGAMGRPTIGDVAAAAGVSTATVSRFLNGVGTVDPELGARVEQAVQTLGYVRNPAGRALRRQRVDMVSAIVPDTRNDFFMGLTYGLESVLSDSGMQVVVGNTDESPARERVYAEAAVSNRFSGVVLAVASQDSEAPKILGNGGIPLVLVDRQVDGYMGPAVTADNTAIGEQAARHVHEMGYRRPAVLASSNRISTTRERAEAFCRTARELGLELPDDLVVSADSREVGAETAMWWLLGVQHDFDCVFATNGPLTAAAFRVLRTAGRLEEPRIGLVGVDDELWTDMVDPAVTVFRQPLEEMGRVAATLLMAQVKRSPIEEESVVLLPELVIRDSTRRR